MRSHDVIKYYPRFHEAMSDLKADYSRVPHPFAAISYEIARLACLIHAASVHSEPGSNSPKTTWPQNLAFIDNKMSKIVIKIDWRKELIEDVRDCPFRSLRRLTEQQFFVKYFFEL